MSDAKVIIFVSHASSIPLALHLAAGLSPYNNATINAPYQVNLEGHYRYVIA